MFNEGNKTRYYHIRASIVWCLIFIVAVLFICCFYRKEIYNAWLKFGGRVRVSYVGVESKLDNVAECQLCGNSDDSMMDYYRKFNTLGVICVNDWNIFELDTQMHYELEDELEQHLGTRSCMGTTEEYDYETNSIPGRGIAEVKITLSKEHKIDILSLQKRLCQDCLDKILEAIEYNRWKNEKSEPLPMCLVDFKTLKIYSLQEASQKLYIDKFYVRARTKGNKLNVEVILTQ